jgi:hypothetical protein
MVLGLLSILILCVPIVGYAAVGLGTLGVLLGFAGLVSALIVSPTRHAALRSTAAACPRFGERAHDFPLAGIGTSLLALGLALLPFLGR